VASQDRAGAGLVLDKIRRRSPWLDLIWADGGYNAWRVDAAVAKVPPLRVEIVKRRDERALSYRAAGWSSAPSPGLAAIGVSPRTSRTPPKPWSPSLSSPLSSLPSGGSQGVGRELKNQRLANTRRARSANGMVKRPIAASRFQQLRWRLLSGITPEFA